MKTLLLNGSPRGGASDTLRLSTAFLEGLGEPYERIHLIDQPIAPCRGCLACWKLTPGACVQSDGAAEILQKIENAELVIWSMPLYCYGMPSHVKALVDRLLPLSTRVQYSDADGRTHHETRGAHLVRHMLIAGCEFPDHLGNFDALVMQFQRLFGAGSPMILCAEAPMLSAPEAKPVTQPYMDAVRDAGRETARDGRISEETGAFLRQPMLDPEIYRNICSGK